MPSCHEMRNGMILRCPDCGLELKVVKECSECSGEEGTCCEGGCTFECCGGPLEMVD